MSRYFPQSVYAEDQQLAKTILTTHVLYRGFQTGASVGIAFGASRYLYWLSRSESRLRAASKSSASASASASASGSAIRTAVHPTFSQTIFRHAGVGGAVGTMLLVVGLAGRMKGKEEIEWQDRSWRLLQNQGQLEVDDWSLGGAFAGALSSVLRKQKNGPKYVVGRTAVGSMVGVLGYMAYRYGWWKGKRNEELR